ncbi:MAG: phosphate propanoyltransferase [Clostridia bacterium]|nr:phosphate propanoyltransferase [Clostridia bacterium]
MGYMVPVGISNKHLHLSKEDLEALFGPGYELHPTKDLKQPGQYAAEEKVDLVGPKGVLKGVRVLGPVRGETQVELAFTDARALGINVPVKESGKLEDTPGIKLVGPLGEVEIKKGAIAALRHIHLSGEQAIEAGVVDKQIVNVKVPGERGLIFENVLVRAGDAYEKEIHLDTDEANAAGLSNDAEVEILV